MNTVRFVKSFSKGQITIPKEFRDTFGMGDDFWLKLSLQADKIIAEPINNGKKDIPEYRKKLLNIKGVWDLEKEITRNREQVENQLKKRSV